MMCRSTLPIQYIIDVVYAPHTRSTQKSYTLHIISCSQQNETHDVQALPDSKHLILYFIYDLCLKNVSNAMQTKINNSLAMCCCSVYVSVCSQELYVLYILNGSTHNGGK